ncbi:ABC transporter permease, partial [Roseateles chitinivorans]
MTPRPRWSGSRSDLGEPGGHVEKRPQMKFKYGMLMPLLALFAVAVGFPLCYAA